MKMIISRMQSSEAIWLLLMSAAAKFADRVDGKN
jgi:hypothetical protein